MSKSPRVWDFSGEKIISLHLYCNFAIRLHPFCQTICKFPFWNSYISTPLKLSLNIAYFFKTNTSFFTTYVQQIATKERKTKIVKKKSSWNFIPASYRSVYSICRRSLPQFFFLCFTEASVAHIHTNTDIQAINQVFSSCFDMWGNTVGGRYNPMRKKEEGDFLCVWSSLSNCGSLIKNSEPMSLLASPQTSSN